MTAVRYFGAVLAVWLSAAGAVAVMLGLLLAVLWLGGLPNVKTWALIGIAGGLVLALAGHIALRRAAIPAGPRLAMQAAAFLSLTPIGAWAYRPVLHVLGS